MNRIRVRRTSRQVPGQEAILVFKGSHALQPNCHMQSSMLHGRLLTALPNMLFTFRRPSAEKQIPNSILNQDLFWFGKIDASKELGPPFPFD